MLPIQVSAILLLPFIMTKYLRSFLLALPLLYLSFLLPSVTMGATNAPGLTIITHGYQFTDSMPQWPYKMSKEIQKKTEHEVYEVKAESCGPLNADICTSFWSENNFSEIDITKGAIVLLNWADLSQVHSSIPTTQMGDLFFNDLFINNKFGVGLAQVPIHLIGHSRGASLNTQLAGRLAQQGILIDHVTSLDPHPIEVPVDANMTTYANTIFADNYYRKGVDGFDGETVYGAASFGGYNLGDLTSSMDDESHEPEDECTDAHSRVHTYYHGTINTEATDDGTDKLCQIHPEWYDRTYDREAIGFNYSRISTKPRPLSGVFIGLNVSNGTGTGGRITFNDAAQIWPNAGFDQSAVYPIQLAVGEASAPISYYFSDRDSEQTISFYLDNDQNPYNGHLRFITSVKKDKRADALIGSDTFSWTPITSDVSDTGAPRHIFVCTHDSNSSPSLCTENSSSSTSRVRYDVLLKPINILPSSENIPSVSITSPCTSACSTSLSTISISGSASDIDGSGSGLDKVYVYNQTNESNLTDTSVSTGSFSVSGITLNSGSNTIKAIAYDAAGNVSNEDTIYVTYQLPNDGVCGSSNGDTFINIPTTNLCLTGTASAVAGTGPWNWTCTGFDGGSDASCSANTISQTALVNDGVVLSSISVPGEMDEFTFEANAGEAVHIRVVDTSGGLYPNVWLYNPDGTLNQVSNDSTTVEFDCRASSSSCQLNQTGTYRLLVEDYYGTYTGNYGVQLVRVLQSNENGSLVNDGVVSGDIAVGDIDTFVFTASAGEAVHIRVVDTSGGLYPNVWLYNPDGTLNQVSNDSTTVEFDCRASSSSCQLNQTGTYRLLVEDYYGTYTGNYGVQLVRVLQSNENGSLVNDGVVSGDIAVGDIDTFVFTASAGEAVHIRVVDTSGGLYPNVWLYNPDGTLNQVSNDSTTVEFDCRASSSSCQLNQTGTYRLLVEDYYGTYTGNYGVQLVRVLQSNENGSLVNDGVVSGDIAVGDIDTFVFTASAGEAVHIRVVDTSGGLYPNVWLYNPDGTLNQVSNDSTTVEFDCRASSSSCQLNQTGTYRLLVEDYYGTYTGNYGVQLVRVLQSNENGSLVNDGVVSGDIAVGDIDTFVFTASAGEAVHIRVVDTSGGLYPNVWLYNPDGTLNRVSNDSTTVEFDCRASSSSCQLNQTGTYRLLVEDYYGTYTGNYGVQLVRVLQSNENGSLVNDGVVSGDIAVGDIDTFVFTASAGEAVHIRVVDTSGGLYPNVWLYNPDGTLNQVSNDSTTVEFDCRASSSSCQLNQTGTYRLLVEDYYGTYTGNYGVQLVRVLQSNENGSLVNDGVVSGDIAVGDIDTFVFTASAGEAVHIRVVDTSGGLYPNVWLYNPDGTLNRVSNDSTTVEFDCRASSSSCQLNQTGTYRLLVEDYYGTYTGNYEISFDGPSQVDLDGDGIPSDLDNCPAISNPGQIDTDNDGQGDACDLDDDNDGLSDLEEDAWETNPLVADTDGDGVSDSTEVAEGRNPNLNEAAAALGAINMLLME